MKKAIIFDLDGTLFDTLEDLACATNYALEKYGQPTCTIQQVRSYIGNGVKMLISRALKDRQDLLDDALAEFKKYYANHLLDNTKPYNGVIELIELLKNDGYYVGVVSNKFNLGVVSITQRYLSTRCDVAIGEQEGMEKKPNPQMVNLALNKLNVSSMEAIYVGDSIVDYQTAINANMEFIGVTYGYGTEKLLAANPKYLAQEPKEVYERIKEIIKND